MEKRSEESLNGSSILERLHQYGESWLDDDDYQKFVRKKQSRLKTSQLPSHNAQSGDLERATKTETRVSRRQKKKLKKKMKIFSEDSSVENSANISDKKPSVKQKRKNKHIEQLKSELQLDRNLSKTKEMRKDMTINQTAVIKPVGSDGKVFLFEDPAKRKQKKKTIIPPALEESSVVSPEVPAQPKVNLHQARHDVKMFGITGFQGQQKETAVTDMLVKLGAKPPKRSFCSIKEFMERKEKNGTSAASSVGQKGGMKNFKSNKRRRKRKNDIGFLDGQIGSYRSGVQILKRDDIQRVKKFKVKK